MMITQAKGRGLCSGEDNSEWNRDFLSISTINQLLIESVVKIKKKTIVVMRMKHFIVS